MSLDLVALEIARAWGQLPGWVFGLERGEVEEMIGWWRATQCEAPAPRKVARPGVSASSDGAAFWLGG